MRWDFRSRAFWFDTGLFDANKSLRYASVERLRRSPLSKTLLTEIIARHESDLLAEWMRLQKQTLAARSDRVSETQLAANSKDFLRAISAALSKGAGADIETAPWSEVRELLGELGRRRVTQGFSPSETAMFVFSFKQPLFARIGAEYESNPKALQEEFWTATEILDKLGLYTFETFLKTREEVIARQQREMLELSTPVVELWNGVLALPVIGTLDSERTQIVMQSLLETIVAKGADLAIIDIYRCADRGHSGGATSFENGSGSEAHGCGLRDQRDSAADCSDHYSSGR